MVFCLILGWFLLPISDQSQASFCWVQVQETSQVGTGPESGAVVVEEPKIPPEVILEKGKNEFSAREFDACIDTLKPLVGMKLPEAMILTADAFYARGRPEDLESAQGFYFKVIYEFLEAPFKDHCYYRIAEIYNQQKNPFEANLYYQQTLKKFPNSTYVPSAALSLFQIAERGRNLKDLKMWAGRVAQIPGQEPIKEQSQYVYYIYRKTKQWDKVELESVFNRNRLKILRFPLMARAYAQRMKSVGLDALAKKTFLDVVNFFPDHEGRSDALLEVANFERASGNKGAAVFLYKQVIEKGVDPKAETKAMIQVADMIAQAQITSLEVLGKEWNYTDLLTAIRFSVLSPGERAPFVYRQALLQAVSDPPSKALLTLRQLTSEYKEGPFASLYRDSYKELLHHTVSNFFREKRYWDLDSVYQKHRFFLEHSTDTQYPHMMAKAYMDLGLTAPARDIFEAMWREKENIEGFELAFEEPFVDYFLLLNDLKLDDFLSTRLPKYEIYYGTQGRFLDRFLLAQTGFEMRTLPAAEIVLRAKTRPLLMTNIFDAKRLQMLAMAAQEAQDWGFANQLLKGALAWEGLDRLLPFLFRTARVFDADYQFRVGNYFAARRKYRELSVDPAMLPDERVWADLQLARLFEMKGERKRSIEYYGQVALNVLPETIGYAHFAKLRLEALAFETELNQNPQGVLIGEN